MTEISEEQALNRLRAKVTYTHKVKDLAADFDVSAAFMSMVLGGKKQMTQPMLDAIGLERKTVYTDKEAE